MLRHGYGYIMMLLRDPIAAWPMVPDGDPLSRPHYYCHVPHTSPHAIWPGACPALMRGDGSWLHCCTCCRPPAISARTRRGFNFKSVLRKQEQSAAAPSLAGCLWRTEIIYTNVISLSPDTICLPRTLLCNEPGTADYLPMMAHYWDKNIDVSKGPRGPGIRRDRNEIGTEVGAGEACLVALHCIHRSIPQPERRERLAGQGHMAEELGSWHLPWLPSCLHWAGDTRQTRLQT